jgi:hypothetical protein
MADYTDTMSAHLDRCVEEGGSSFVLTHDAKGWTATGTKKHGRKEIVGTGDTAMLAAADFLAKVRGEPTETSEDVAETAGEIPPPAPRPKF